jgi:hypothetical protein
MVKVSCGKILTELNKNKMNLTKGQIMMIHNMVNCELSNKNTVYSITELVNLKEQLTLTDVVATLPNINSSVFKNWLKVNKYAETMNRLVYSKKDWDYDIDVLYRAFTNEIEFGN